MDSVASRPGSRFSRPALSRNSQRRKTMYKTAFSLIALVPAALAAQVAVGASARTDTKADARVGKSTSASVASSASVDAEISAARAHGVPERPIRRRVAEGRAKGASEAQVAAAAQIGRASCRERVERGGVGGAWERSVDVGRGG